MNSGLHERTIKLLEAPERIIVSILLNLKIYPEIWSESFLHFDLFVGILLHRFDLLVGILFEPIKLSSSVAKVRPQSTNLSRLLDIKVLLVFERMRLSCEMRLSRL